MDIMDRYVEWEANDLKDHQGCTFSSKLLKKIQKILPENMEATAETGCGKSTILFSNISKKHFVFALDDRDALDNSSVNFYRNCPLTEIDNVIEIFGPTQKTLPVFEHSAFYDCVLIDGPHGFPFPELEYYFFYPRIKEGGFLIIDDVNIPTIGRMADILADDEAWNLIEIVGCTAIFRRTNHSITDPFADDWWKQMYNRMRVSKNRSDVFVKSDSVKNKITSLKLDQKLHKDRSIKRILKRLFLRG